MITAGYVSDFLEYLLTTVVSTFQSAGVALPARRFVTFGTPAADGEQLTVALQQLYLGKPGQPPSAPNPCNDMMTAVVRIEILRQAPTPETRRLTIPAIDLDAAGKTTVNDAELLLLTVSNLCGSRTGSMGFYADVTMPNEQGALSGPIMTITAGVL